MTYFIFGLVALIISVYIVIRSQINNKRDINEHVTQMANLLHDRIALYEIKVSEIHNKLDTVVENTKSLANNKIDDEDEQIKYMLNKIKSFGGSVLEQIKETN